MYKLYEKIKNNRRQSRRITILTQAFCYNCLRRSASTHANGIRCCFAHKIGFEWLISEGVGNECLSLHITSRCVIDPMCLYICILYIWSVCARARVQPYKATRQISSSALKILSACITIRSAHRIKIYTCENRERETWKWLGKSEYENKCDDKSVFILHFMFEQQQRRRHQHRIVLWIHGWNVWIGNCLLLCVVRRTVCVSQARLVARSLVRFVSFGSFSCVWLCDRGSRCSFFLQ